MRGNEGRLALCLLLIVSWSEAPSWSADPLPTTEADTAEGEEGLAPDSPFVARQVETWLGDLEGLRERRRVRALVVQSRTGFFIERGQPRGFEVDLLEAWEDRLNAGATRRDRRVQVVYVPVTVEELIPSLLAGRGDIAAAGITVTDARRQQVAFSAPYLRDVDELFVVSRSAPPVETTDDLAGRRVHVPRGTSFAAHLAELSAQLVARGLQPIEIVEVDPRLDVEDLIEMVHAGIFEITVADEQVALLWARVLNGIVVREDLSLRDGGEIAWAVRPDSRELRASLDAFVNQNRRGSLLGNILFRRYFVDTRWIRNPVDADGLATFDRYGPLIRRYADQYHLDWLKLAALAYQESGLRQDRVSPRGAVGLMQVLPTTAAYLGFPNPRNLDQNVHAGVKYVALLRTEVGRAGSPAPDAQYDFTLAAYNMGRGRLRQMRRQAGERGLDPDTWFDNVEIVTLERVGQEPVRYVANINKLYVAYSLAMHDRAERERKRRLHEERSP